MKTDRISRSCIPAVAAMLATLTALAAPFPARAEDPHEMSKEIIAVQLRKQGFQCGTPLSATREGDATKYDDAVWVLKCNNATYKVQLIPNMAAKVEQVPDAAKDDAKSTSP